MLSARKIECAVHSTQCAEKAGRTETGRSAQEAVRSAQGKLKDVTSVFENSKIFPSLTHKVCQSHCIPVSCQRCIRSAKARRLAKHSLLLCIRSAKARRLAKHSLFPSPVSCLPSPASCLPSPFSCLPFFPPFLRTAHCILRTYSCALHPAHLFLRTYSCALFSTTQ